MVTNSDFIDARSTLTNQYYSSCHKDNLNSICESSIQANLFKSNIFSVWSQIMLEIILLMNNWFWLFFMQSKKVNNAKYVKYICIKGEVLLLIMMIMSQNHVTIIWKKKRKNIFVFLYIISRMMIIDFSCDKKSENKSLIWMLTACLACDSAMYAFLQSTNIIGFGCK